jgi:hypothetical protein
MESIETKGSRTEIEDLLGYHNQTIPHIVVEYILHPDTTYKIFLGFTNNLNESGFSLYTTKLLEKGQEIIVKISIPCTCRKAVVCSVEQHDSFYYKVGLEFTA